MTNVKGKWWLVMAVLVFSLVLAACGEEAADATPGVEDPGLVEPGEMTEEGAVIGGEEEEPLELEATQLTPQAEATEEMMTPEVTEDAEMEEAAQLVPAQAQWLNSARLIGLPVYSQDTLQISEVDDVLFDQQGNIAYVIFNATDFLASEDVEDVAVPWGSLQVQALQRGDLAAEDAVVSPPAGDVTATPAEGEEEEGALTDEERTFVQEAEELVLVYTGGADMLQSEQVVNREVYDNADLYVDFVELTTVELEDDVEDDVEATEEAVEDDAEAEATEEVAPAEGETTMIGEGQFFLMSRVQGYDLVNTQGENLGGIDQFIVDLQQGLVAYAVTDVGGFLGIGANSVAIPWERLTFDEAQEAFVVDVDAETLEQAPVVELGDWEAGAVDNAWSQETDTFWQDVDAGIVGPSTEEEDAIDMTATPEG